MWDVHHIDHGCTKYWIFGGAYDNGLPVQPQVGKMVSQHDVRPFLSKLVVVPSTYQVTYTAHDAASYQQGWRDYLDRQERQRKSKIEHFMGVGKDLICAGQK